MAAVPRELQFTSAETRIKERRIQLQTTCKLFYKLLTPDLSRNSYFLIIANNLIAAPFLVIDAILVHNT